MERLIGRKAELERLDRLLGGAREQGSAIGVIGEPGVGKSALLAALELRAAARGMGVLKVTGIESEARLPSSGLNQLVHPILARVEELPRSQRDALMGAVGHEDLEVADFFALALAMLTLLRDGAAAAPLLLIAEDAHWIDQATADVLAFAARRIALDPIVIVASSRTPLDGALGDAIPDQLVLTGLKTAAATEVVAERAPHLTPELQRRLLVEAKGNPLALVELAATWSQLPAGSAVSSWLPVTTKIERAFADRLDALPPESRTLLLAAALVDSDAVTEIVNAAEIVCGAPIGPDAISCAIQARLVTLDGRSLRFRHPIVRSVVYQAATLSERLAVHASLATVLHDDRAVWHKASSSLLADESIAVELDAAAAQARRRGALTAAIAALKRAADLSPEPSKRGHRLLTAAGLALQLGYLDTARAHIDEAERLDLDRVDRAHAAWRRQQLSSDTGVPQELGTLRQALSLIEHMGTAGDADKALDALVPISTTAWMFGYDLERRALIGSLAERLPVAQDDSRLLAILANTIPVERGPELLERIAAARTRAAGFPGGLGLLGIAASQRGAFPLAAELLEETIRTLRTQGRIAPLAFALTSYAWSEFWLGDWGAAAAAADASVRIEEHTDETMFRVSSQLALALVAAVRGDLTAADETLSQVEDWALLGPAESQRLAHLVRGVRALAAGEYDEAYERLRRMHDPDALSHDIVMLQGSLIFFVDAALHAGHGDSARELVAELQTRGWCESSPIVRASLLAVQPMLAEDPVEAERLFDRAAEADLESWPFIRANLLLAQGTWLRRQRRTSDARDPLRAARDAFDALGATPWGDRARQELRATGESSARPVGKAVDQLTPQELEIARLAARGMTNREIGQRLYLSHRTVGSHLYRLFPKLGVTSRRELDAAIGRTLTTGGR